MNFPFFRKRIFKGTTWKELREKILSAIEEEKRNKAIASYPTVISADLIEEIPSEPEHADTLPTGCTADLIEEIPSEPEHADTLPTDCTAHQDFYDQRSYSPSEAVNKKSYK